jgi:glyoxylase-like metal-dependent hydrolase (beta-lactamase superfamily II)
VAGKPDAKLIDVLQLGRERVIGAWDLGGAIVDPGPESRMETLLAGLTQEPRALLLTHVHLDHAGAAGALVERFPGLEVWVHAKGAPHIADPTKLVASASRLYGERMGPLWGRVVPVPEANLRVLEGGERIEAAGRRLAVEYTPGHASHHVVYFDESDGTAYVGDVAGVRIPPSDLVQPPTPPPDIDVPAWMSSIDLVAEREPSFLALTHFGHVDQPLPHLERTKEALGEMSELAREVLADHGDTPEAMQAFVAEVNRRAEQRSDAATAAGLRDGSPIEQRWKGLSRYWQKQAAVG